MHRPPHPRLRPSRRDVLQGVGATLGLSLLGKVQAAAALGRTHGAVGPPSFGRAKRCIFLFMFGGPSQHDLFDYKPELQRRDGQTIDLERRVGDVRPSVILGSKRRFARYGDSGQWCSDALPNVARHMDRLAVVKSLTTDSFAHGSAVLKMNSGEIRQGYPSMGSWVTYGRETANERLPNFVVMHDPRGGPISGPANWSSGFMPAVHQGTLFRSSGEPLLDLAPAHGHPRRGLTARGRADQVALLNAINDRHRAGRPDLSELDARAASYALALEMEDSAREALDLRTEDEATLRMYGLVNAPPSSHRMSLGPGPFGRQCLIARRLLERGVTFVQIYHGGGHQQQTWDAHHGVEENLAIHCPEIDLPIAGLLEDLARTGLLDETLVIWGGEFGRQPVSQAGGEFQVANPLGRDHNPKGFTMWLAGAGVKPGSYGETDELGREAVRDVHPVRDFHATALHLLGLDHEALTYRYAGLDRKLTGVREAHPIAGVLA